MRLGLSIARFKIEYYIGFTIGIFLVAANIYLIYYYFVLGRYPLSHPGLVGNIGLIIFGIIIMIRTYPIFIPIKKNTLFQSARTCPHCCAIIEKDAIVCKKCKQQID